MHILLINNILIVLIEYECSISSIGLLPLPHIFYSINEKMIQYTSHFHLITFSSLYELYNFSSYTLQLANKAQYFLLNKLVELNIN
jgi:plasmid rolling circle replication initiator protein Rep